MGYAATLLLVCCFLVCFRLTYGFLTPPVGKNEPIDCPIISRNNYHRGCCRRHHYDDNSLQALSLPSESSSSPEASRARAAVSLSSHTTEISVSDIIRKQKVIIDGAEWRSYKRLGLLPPSKLDSGLFSIVVWETNPGTKTKERFMGWSAASPGKDSSTHHQVYQSSVVSIPSSISTPDAVTTMMQALPIHAVCSRRRASGSLNGQKTNGDASFSDSSFSFSSLPTSFPSSHVVVWGSTFQAQQTATALAKLGSKVTVVTTSASLKLANVDVKPPAIPRSDDDDDANDDFDVAAKDDEDNDDDDDDDNMLPVCSALQNFDAMIDTLGDERALGILSLLKSRHGCHTYISTLSHSQEIIEKKGLLFGPGAAKSYLREQQQSVRDKIIKSQKQTQKQTQNVPPSSLFLAPPEGLGDTVAAMLRTGAVLKAEGGGGGGGGNDDVFIPGWSLPAFWESTTWPRETEGGGGRFGMPVVSDLLVYDYDDDDEYDGKKQSWMPTLKKRDDAAAGTSSAYDKLNEDVEYVDENPFVRTIVGVNSLQQRIIQPQEDCLLFLSAPFCRTCRYLGPLYTRMARLNEKKIVFAKADTTGLLGKELGRYLRVKSVPTFVFFSKGKRVGKPLGITKLPSKRLQAKVDELTMTGDLNDDHDDDDDNDDDDDDDDDDAE